jgi:elongation factor G
MKAIVWEDATLGMTYKEVPIPDDMVDDVAEWRQHLIEAVADYDEKLVRKILRRSKYYYRRRSTRSDS